MKRKCDPSNSKAAIWNQRWNRVQSNGPCLKKGQDKKKKNKKKETGQPCLESCKRERCELNSLDNCEAIFSKYWDIGDADKHGSLLLIICRESQNNATIEKLVQSGKT